MELETFKISETSDVRCTMNMIRITIVVWAGIAQVGIATRYGLDGTRIESRWGGAIFSAPVQTGPGAGAEISLPPGFDLRTVQSVASHYTD